MAERRIVEQTGYGIVCFISNYSWLDGLSFTGMREWYLESFDGIWIDSLNGDAFRTGKVTPTGEPDPSVFSTEFNREGIRVGTAIAQLVRQAAHGPAQAVMLRQWWGKTKRTDLINSLHQPDANPFHRLEPAMGLGLPFMLAEVNIGYLAWPLLSELLPTSFPGVKTSRDDLVIDIDRQTLVQRMSDYFDPQVSNVELQRRWPGSLDSSGKFKAERTRQVLQQRGYLPDMVMRYYYRPYDMRWLYWEPDTELVDRKRPEYVPHVIEGNLWIEARQKQTIEKFDRGMVTRTLADNFGAGLSNYFPLYLKSAPSTSPLFDAAQGLYKANLSAGAETYLSTTECTPQELFHPVVATLRSPAYARENGGGLRQNWPRIPLPASRERLEASAALGRQVAALLDTENPVPGVTAGSIRPELRPIAVVEGPTPLDLEVRAGWGSAGRAGVTMIDPLGFPFERARAHEPDRRQQRGDCDAGEAESHWTLR